MARRKHRARVHVHCMRCEWKGKRVLWPGWRAGRGLTFARCPKCKSRVGALRPRKGEA